MLLNVSISFCSVVGFSFQSLSQSNFGQIILMAHLSETLTSCLWYLPGDISSTSDRSG